MGGAISPQIDHNFVKIKGGNWTVARFFVLSVAYTSVWLAVSSELGYYRSLYGPEVLLYLNIAYYAPSIPLLLFSSFFDETLEAAFGTAKTILARLLFGLVGYGCVCAWFPFMPLHLWVLLSAVVALGLFSSIAFSASYQMVSRFANKNTIALGLGCSASGPLILVLQITLGLKAFPTFEQQVALFLIIAVVVASGLWATVSLLFRHWDAIEASGDSVVEEDITAPLLGDLSARQDDDAEVGGSLIENGQEFTFATPVGAVDGVEGGSPRAESSTRTLYKTPSLSPLIAYNLLEPYETFLSAREDWTPSPILRRTSSREGERRRSSREGSPSLSGCAPIDSSGGSGGRGGLYADGEFSPPSLALDGTPNHSENDIRAIFSDDASEDGELSSVNALRAAISDIWPALIAVGLQGGIALTLFPFFTYLPSSGRFNDSLPKVLFFVRIFSDILGRILPRSNFFKPLSIRPVMVIALIKLAIEPLFFVYLKSDAQWHSDIAAVVYIAFMWAAGGYVNTTAYMVAPQMVQKSNNKSTAAGLMAMTYQLGHFIGLATAALLARLMYRE